MTEEDSMKPGKISSRGDENDPYTDMVVLAESFEELAKGVSEDSYGMNGWENLRTKLAQVSEVAERWIEALDRAEL